MIFSRRYIILKIIKRDGSEVVFDKTKIYNAVQKANSEVTCNFRLSDEEIHAIADTIEHNLRNFNHSVDVEHIQDSVEDLLMKSRSPQVARKYITYRYTHNVIRNKNEIDDKVLCLLRNESETINQENSNKNPVINSVQRDYMAGEVSKDLTRRVLLPDDIVRADEEGIIHFHDADYFAQPMYNCCLVNLEDMLQNGTVISETLIEKPHSFSTACTIATQIIAQVASNQYGGQSITLSHLAPFVDVSRQKIRDQIIEELNATQVAIDDSKLDEIVEMRVRDEVRKGIQTIQYQVVTLMTTNGQAPFVTVFMYLDEVPEGQLRDDLAMIIEEVLNQRIQGVKNEKGVWVTPAFPKLIYVLEEDNIYEDSKYFYLTKIAARCAAKRMVPDCISEKQMKALKQGNCFPAMGCRSFLSPWQDENGNYKFYGRFNKGVVTINLPDVALSAINSNPEDVVTEFFKIFDERLELCHKALLCRYERLKGTVSDVAPILWQHGAIARLNKGETIDKYLTGGYSTISLGYAGLWECVYALSGYKLCEEEGKKCGKTILEYMNQKCAEWDDELNLGFGIYGTPLESTTYTFAKSLQKRFGIVPGVTDKNYITNSYHVHVTEPIDAFTKLSTESEFQSLSTGGAISYIEVANLQNNIPAVISVFQYMYEHIMYAEINTKSDFCQVCGYDGEIQIVEDEDHKLIWRCPNCGNTDQSKMNVARRTCGYIGTNFWNQGRTQEIKERVLHL